MIKKILLIRPGSYPEGLTMPLGLLYLAGYLEEKMPGIEVKILDAALTDMPAEEIAERVSRFDPDCAGLTGLTVHAEQMKETAAAIRRKSPRVKIIAGGPAVSSDCEDLLRETDIDFGVIGEGENTLLCLLDCLNTGGVLNKVAGLVYKDGGNNLIRNGPRGHIQDLDTVPFPAYRLINTEDYFNSSKRVSQSPVYISRKNMPVLTSRGCPYRCLFCHDIFGKKFRPRGARNVIDEIVWLKEKYVIEELEIIDDIFNFDKNRAKDILEGLIEADIKLKISFPNGIKYEMIDDEMLGLFKKAGVYRLAFGIESGNRRVQELIGKPVDLNRMKDIIDRSAKAGFFVSGFFQLGLPGETKDEMMDTVNYAASTRLHTAMFHLTIPFPGTPMYEQHVRTKPPARVFQSCRDISVNLSSVSDAELRRIKKRAFMKFYFNPVRMARTYAAFPVKRRLWANFLNVLSEIFFRKWFVQT